MPYKQQRNYENLQKAAYPGVGGFDIPQIRAMPGIESCDFIGFNYASVLNEERSNRGIHFFLDDYQFVRVWTDVERYTKLLEQFRYVMTPDFSLYTDFPRALQIYNHYRKHWLGVYWQEHGLQVIPTISWSDETSYAWCFDGEPVHGVVAVSSVGCMRYLKSKNLFLKGYDAMLERLQPTQIIFYGNPPEECRGDIIRISAYAEQWRKEG